MAVKIRLTRMGAKKKPFYRIIVADSRNPRDGRAIQEIGYYDPTAEPVVIKIDTEAAQHWLNKGAQPTETVRSLLKRAGVVKKANLSVKPEISAEAIAAEPKDETE